MPPIIQTKHLKKYYGKHRGIEDIDLEVQQADIFGFIGPNGAGKSTFIRVILGLISKTSGDARVFGLDARPSHPAILSRIGYLPSESSLYTAMRVKDAIQLSANVKGQKNPDYINQLYERLQLDPNRKIEDLSLGNRKKVSIICALQNKPDLLILDEPTSGLDPLVQHEFWSCIMEQQREGATVFLSSHILSEIQQHCNRAAFIRQGRLIQSDDLENLRSSSLRRILLRSDRPIEQLEALAHGLESVRDLHPISGGVRFLYQGDMNLFVQRLGDFPLRDLQITEPDLEEIFLTWYDQSPERQEGPERPKSTKGQPNPEGGAKK